MVTKKKISKKNTLSFQDTISYATPRRLAVVIKGLDIQTPDKDLVIWGPPVGVAFDKVGQATKAAQAFGAFENQTLYMHAKLC